MGELKKKVISGVLWTSIQQLGNQAVGFVISIILARLLLPSEFGVLGMISIFMGMATVLVTAGLTTSIIRTEKPENDDYSTVFIFNLVASIIIALILFLIAPLISNFYEQSELKLITRLFCIMFILNALSTVQLTKLRKELNFKKETYASIVSTVFFGITAITMAFLGYGVYSLVWGQIISSLINTIMLWVQSDWRPSFDFNKTKFKYHFSFGSKIAISSIIDVIFTNLYIVIIGKFFSATSLGFYTRANSVRLLPVTSLSGIINKVAYPLFAEIGNDNIRLKSVYRQIMKMLMFILTPTLTLMTVLAEPMFNFLFTEKWLPAVPYFQILCINGLLLPLHNYNLNILTVKGRSDLYLKLEITKRVFMIIVILISFQFGIIGLVWGLAFYSIIIYFINTYYSGKFIDYPAWEQLRDIMPIIIISAISGILVFFLDRQFYNLPDILRLIIGVSSGILIYLFLAKVFNFQSLTFFSENISKHLKRKSN